MSKASYQLSNGDWADVVVLLDATTNQPANSGTHTFTYNGGGQILTDTWVVGGITYVKTYTYNGSGQLTSYTDWVKQ